MTGLMHSALAKYTFRVLVAALVLVCSAQSVDSQSIELQKLWSNKGEFMADKQGRALYVYDLDVHNQSNCLDKCAETWPPFEASDDAFGSGGFAIVQHPDGHRMWTLLGRPLYTYSKDKQKFDSRGNGVDGRWHVLNMPSDNDL